MERSDFGAFGGVLRRRAWLVVFAVIAAVAGALVYSRSQPKQYQATSELLFRQVLLDVQLTGVPLQVQSSDPTVASADDVQLVSAENVFVAAAGQLGPGYTADSLQNQVSVSPQDKSDLIGIQATANTPQEAARIANVMATSYLQIDNQQTVSEISAAENRLRSQINVKSLSQAQRAGLRAAMIKLAVLSSLGPEDAHFVQPAVPPTSPSSPKPVRNAAIGGVIGLVIGLALAFGLEQFDGRLRRVEDVEPQTGLPLLATVPRSRALRRPPRTAQQLETQDTEPFRQLASRLRHGIDRKIATVLVTSTGKGSGKTTVAVYLAAAAAELGNRVFLLEAELRHPTMATMFNLPLDHGLSTLLQDPEHLPSAVQTINLRDTEPATNGHATGELALLPAGPRTGSATGLLGSDDVRNLIRKCRAGYQLTVVDAPPTRLVADAIPLAKEVDAVIIVARLGKDTAPDIRRLRTDLERLGVEPLGIVANYARRQKNPYYARPRR